MDHLLSKELLQASQEITWIKTRTFLPLLELDNANNPDVVSGFL